METVTHREMRNNSGEILRRVEAGETILVSNNGRAAAMISPVPDSSLEALIARGEARRARGDIGALAAIRRATSSTSTAALIRDSRGEW
ncbi:type II toxin-antitoxin system prevent-host-death family antitoxin [Gryllotalpicola koreensis]|uniref:Antitoxin n=1 Tax=Gryllotalpicola koreensis TaxID=993086 RepID=A0ABP8A198_9MICO